MNYIICRMVGNKLPKQWMSVITKICGDITAYNVEGDMAFKMCKSTEECYNILKSEYQEPFYNVYTEGSNVVITDVKS